MQALLLILAIGAGDRLDCSRQLDPIVGNWTGTAKHIGLAGNGRDGGTLDLRLSDCKLTFNLNGKFTATAPYGSFSGVWHQRRTDDGSVAYTMGWESKFGYSYDKCVRVKRGPLGDTLGERVGALWDEYARRLK